MKRNENKKTTYANDEKDQKAIVPLLQNQPLQADNVAQLASLELNEASGADNMANPIKDLILSVSALENLFYAELLMLQYC